MKGPSPKIGSGNSGFRTGSGVQKNAIKTSKLKASSLTNSKNANGTKGAENGEQNGEQNGNGDVAKAQKEQARTFAQTRPGSTARSAKKAVDRTKSRSQDILNQMKNGRDKNGKSPGSAYNDINASRSAANDAANYQAMIKGSEATAKAIADGAKALGSGAGAIGSALAKMVEKKRGGQASGGGQQSSGGAQGQQQQQQSAQQQQDMIAQTDAQQGGVQNS